MDNTKKYSSEVETLAAKYGVSPDVIADLIGSKIDRNSIPPVAEPLRPVTKSIKGEAYKKAIDEGFSPKDTQFVKKNQGFSAWTLIIAILLIVALVALLKGCPEKSNAPKIADTVAAIIPLPRADTIMQQRTDTAMEALPAIAAPTPSKAKPARATHRSSRSITRPAMTTTSSYQAQQRLATMRAEGNSAARIKTTRRHGETVYQVYPK